MDPRITNLVAGLPAPADGRAPSGARHAEHPDAFGSALAGALDNRAPEHRAGAAARPDRAAHASAPPRNREQARAAAPERTDNAHDTTEAQARPKAAAGRSTAGRPAAQSPRVRQGQTHSHPATSGTAVADARPQETRSSVDGATDEAAENAAGQQDAANADAQAVPSDPETTAAPIAIAAVVCPPDVSLDIPLENRPQAAAFGTNTGEARDIDARADTEAAPEATPIVGAPTPDLPPSTRDVAGPVAAGLAVADAPAAAPDRPVDDTEAVQPSTPDSPMNEPAARLAAERGPRLAAPVPAQPLGRPASPAVATSFFETPDQTGVSPVPGAPEVRPDGAVRPGAAASGDVASFVRATLARYASAAPPADPAPPVRVAGSRPAGLALPVLSDSGGMEMAAVADAQPTTTAVAAARTSFQLAQADVIEPPLWARNELNKVAQWAGDPGAAERLTRLGGGFGGNGSPAAGGQHDQPREGADGQKGLTYAAGFGLTGLPASGALRDAAFQAATARAIESPAEPYTESGPLTHSIVRVVKLQASAGGGEMQLRLRPDHLGELSVSVRVEAGAVTASLRSDSPEVRAWIQQHQQDLRSALKDQGLSLEQLTVDPEGHQQHQRQSAADDSEPRQSGRRQDPSRRFEVLI